MDTFGKHELKPVEWDSCCLISGFLCNILLTLLYVYFVLFPVAIVLCLLFFKLRLLITSLISLSIFVSKSCYTHYHLYTYKKNYNPPKKKQIKQAIICIHYQNIPFMLFCKLILTSILIFPYIYIHTHLIFPHKNIFINLILVIFL